MREGGAKLGAILQDLLAMAQPGVALLDIEARAQELIRQAGGEASFQTVKGYRWATCLCVNDVVVHGVPTPYVLKEGDILTVDVGLRYGGFHTDTAWTKEVKGQRSKGKSEEKETFLRVGEEALRRAIEKVRAGNRVGHISQAIQDTVEASGYSIVKTLVGHGVGRELHEAPQIPGFIRGPVEATPKLEEGMALAIEVIYAMGDGRVGYSTKDGWSIASQDGSTTAVFEHTVLVTEGEPEVLTKPAMYDTMRSC